MTQPARLSGRAGREAVVRALRDAIGRGELAPGQRLVETELSEQFRTTRSSVREALANLANDGVVELMPGRGARVRVIGLDEAVQITECRIALECLCAERAARLASSADRARLRGIGARMTAAVEAMAPDDYSALGRELHQAIVRISALDVAGDLLRRLGGQMVRHQFRLSRRPGRSGVSLHQHLAIIEAIDAGDPAAARTAVTAHLTSVLDALRQSGAAPTGGVA